MHVVAIRKLEIYMLNNHGRMNLTGVSRAILAAGFAYFSILASGAEKKPAPGPTGAPVVLDEGSVWKIFCAWKTPVGTDASVAPPAKSNGTHSPLAEVTPPAVAVTIPVV